MTSPTPEKECCPPFDPAPWDEKFYEWKDKRFIKGKVFTFCYRPIGFGNTITKLFAKVDQAEAKMPDTLCLSDHTSQWNMDLYLAVDKEIPDAENVLLSGHFFSKVYEGDFKDTGKWCEDFKVFSMRKGATVKKQYMWYTTCPKCSKKYGKNYVVIIGQT